MVRWSNGADQDKGNDVRPSKQISIGVPSAGSFDVRLVGRYTASWGEGVYSTVQLSPYARMIDR